jgi:dienelactone hydrolase
MNTPSSIVRFAMALTLAAALLTACAAAPTVTPPTITPALTLPPPTATAVPPPPPTATPPTTPFENMLVYDQPEMYQVTIRTDQYQTLTQPAKMLPMDIYYPPSWQPGTRLPAILFADAFPLSSELGKCGRLCYTYPSWGRLVAANGLIAVTYDSEQASDLEAVAEHVRANGASLGIDGDHLGVMGVSGDATLAESFAYQPNREYVKFAVIYYGYMLTPDNLSRTAYNQLSLQGGFYAAELPDVKELRTDLPVFLVQCGQDNVLDQISTLHFVQLAKEAGAPLTLIDFPEGQHTFDVKETSVGDVAVKAAEIVKQTLEFMKTHASGQ